MNRFEAKQARGGWWVQDAYMQQWTACLDADEAAGLVSELETAAAEGYDAIRRESLQWVRGAPYDPGVDHASFLSPDALGGSPPDTETIRRRT